MGYMLHVLLYLKRYSQTCGLQCTDCMYVRRRGTELPSLPTHRRRPMRPLPSLSHLPSLLHTPLPVTHSPSLPACAASPSSSVCPAPALLGNRLPRLGAARRCSLCGLPPAGPGFHGIHGRQTGVKVLVPDAVVGRGPLRHTRRRSSRPERQSERSNAPHGPSPPMNHDPPAADATMRPCGTVQAAAHVRPCAPKA